MNDKQYVPEKFWDERLDKEWNLRGVGHAGYGMRYNKWLYRSQTRALDRLLKKTGIDLPTSDVLDVGSGTGFWLDFYRERAARSVSGAEMADSAARQLRERYSDLTIHQLNIAKELPDIGQFDVVNIISVLYHIVDENDFAAALINLASLVKPGGWLILSDRMGKTEVRRGSHVRFRSEDRYVSMAGEHGLEIIRTEVMTSLMNGGFARLTRGLPQPINKIRGKLENLLPSPIYSLDGTGMFNRWANMRVVAMRKGSA